MPLTEIVMLDRLSKSRSIELLKVLSPIPDELHDKDFKVIIAFLQMTLARSVISVLANSSMFVNPEIAKHHEEGAMGLELEEFCDLLARLTKLVDWDSVKSARDAACQCSDCLAEKRDVEDKDFSENVLDHLPVEGNS